MALMPRMFDQSLFVDPFSSWGSLLDPYSRGFPTLDRETSAVASTRVDWVETPEAHVFRADLPGMRKEEIKVQVSDDGMLMISGERHKDKVEERDEYRREERSYGKFSRQFRLPPNAQHQDVSAKVENGVLTVKVLKTEEAKKRSPQVRSVDVSG